jgi:hypothetical protein
MDDSILKFVMIVFYVIVPAIWFGILGYASYRVNGVSMDSALEKVHKTASDGSRIVVNRIMKG